MKKHFSMLEKKASVFYVLNGHWKEETVWNNTIENNLFYILCNYQCRPWNITILFLMQVLPQILLDHWSRFMIALSFFGHLMVQTYLIKLLCLCHRLQRLYCALQILCEELTNFTVWSLLLFLIQNYIEIMNK